MPHLLANTGSQGMNVCAHSCLCLQGPYDTVAMRNGCDALEGGTTILTLDIGVNCSSFATFSRQLSEPVKLSSYLGCAVSVQKPSGAILGCGRVERIFPVKAMYNKRITLSQYTPYFPTRFVDSLNLQLDILQYNVLEGIAGTFCNKSAIFDPWSPPPMQIGNKTTPDQFPVGDLHHHPKLFSRFVMLEVPLIGSATVLGHMVCINLSTSDAGNTVHAYNTTSYYLRHCNVHGCACCNGNHIAKGYTLTSNQKYSTLHPITMATDSISGGNKSHARRVVSAS